MLYFLSSPLPLHTVALKSAMLAAPTWRFTSLQQKNILGYVNFMEDSHHWLNKACSYRESRIWESVLLGVGVTWKFFEQQAEFLLRYSTKFKTLLNDSACYNNQVGSQISGQSSEISFPSAHPRILNWMLFWVQDFQFSKSVDTTCENYRVRLTWAWLPHPQSYWSNLISASVFLSLNWQLELIKCLSPGAQKCFYFCSFSQPLLKT